MSAVPRVLIADADLATREALLDLLHRVRADVQVEQCSTGLAALEKFTTWQPHLVIADWQLPGALDGLGLLRLLRPPKREQATPFLLLSERSDAASVRSVLPWQPSAYLSKPLQVEKVQPRLQELLSKPVPVADRTPAVDLAGYLLSCRDNTRGAPVSVNLHTAFRRALSRRSDDMVALERELHKDPQVTGLLIATANAAHQHVGTSAQTLGEAIAHLGPAATLETLFDLSLQPGIVLSAGELLDAANTFWALALRIAHSSRTLARTLGLRAELCFAAGLLHCTGDLAVLRGLQCWVASGGELAPEEITTALREHAASFGSAVRLRWRLPLELRELVAASYQFSGGSGVHSREALVLNLVAQFVRLPEDGDLDGLADSKVARLLKVGIQQLLDLRDEPSPAALTQFLLPVQR